jgi:enoyl-CoA hydratase/carnithine racemase
MGCHLAAPAGRAGTGDRAAAARGPVDADRAAALGLANQVVDDDRLIDQAGELARRLADGPALAYAATKVLLARELDLPLAGALELEAVTQALLLTSEDHREFYAAFTQGRSPTWRGR